jgi:predicted nucleic acid-binding Zn ribbon protein
MVGTAEKISTILQRVIKDNRLGRGLKEAAIKMEWERLVGKEAARHTIPAFLKKGILIVRVDSSVWAYELSTNRKALILKKINEGLEEETVKDIHFKVRDLRSVNGD